MQNLLEELKKLLEQDERLVVEGKLLKNKIIELALKLDVDLIRLLLKSETIKTHFFQEVDGVLVFDKIKFQKFVSNKAFLPDSYTSFKNKIGLVTENEEYLSESKEVVLAWPYKDCVLKGGMEKENEKRDEIFYNEILAPDEIDRLLEPKVLTNFKRIDKDGEYKVRELKENDNLIIRGNNLLALHSLQKRFSGKVKLIYVDPPYNTGNDSFKYNDSFNHSTWLTFMKNRLEVAKDLLKGDGVIFISIDGNEQAYLKTLCDDVFGRENFIGLITIKSTPGGRQSSKNISIMGDYLIVYGKSDKTSLLGLPLSAEQKEKYNREDEHGKFLTERLRQHGVAERKEDVPTLHFPIYYNKNTKEVSTTKKPGFDIEVFPILPDGEEGRWIWSKEKVEKDKHRIEIRKVKRNGEYIYDAFFIKYLNDELRSKLPNIWTEKEFRTEVGTKELKAVFGGVKVFAYPKPEPMIGRIIECSTLPQELVLDFFVGSGTTCAVAHKMGRHYIGIEQMDYVENVTIKRIKEVINGDQSSISKSVGWQGGGEFTYCELMKLNEKYIDEIKKAKTAKELLDIWKTMKDKIFLSYKVDVKQFDENVNEFEQLSIENQKKFLIECLDKNQLYVNLSEIDDTEYEINKEDKELNKQFYEVK